jgi:preprotein translocase subunit SecF
MAQEYSLKQVAIGAWGGICLGIASITLLVALGSKFFTNPILFSLISGIIDTLLLAGGIAGFLISRKMKKGSRSRRRK